MPSRVARVRKVAGAADRHAFEMRWLRKRHEGSNPSPSASSLAVAQLEERRATKAEGKGSIPLSEARYRV